MIDPKVSMGPCPACCGVLSSVSEEKEVRIGRRSARVMDDFGRCADCGEAFYAPGQMDSTLRRATEAIRQEEGLLSSEVVQEIREKLGLTQQAFERLLGVGPKTVVRWEKGTVFQNRSTDSLLRVIDAVPDSARFLARLRGVTLPDHPKLAAR
jgi:HTH-type transcriptional regulator/antitoxin MqsA